ncbi:MAG: hypothetical protein LAC70_02765 [Methylovulum sp.]|nr:hypothetical protein [Methylovulum sp.]
MLRLIEARMDVYPNKQYPQTPDAKTARLSMPSRQQRSAAQHMSFSP